ncbi:hypothetical protein ACU6U9_10325 [Pseudomonas sp. HK3]|jgi:hypothetical protein
MKSQIGLYLSNDEGALMYAHGDYDLWLDNQVVLTRIKRYGHALCRFF